MIQSPYLRPNADENTDVSPFTMLQMQVQGCGYEMISPQLADDVQECKVSLMQYLLSGLDLCVSGDGRFVFYPDVRQFADVSPDGLTLAL